MTLAETGHRGEIDRLVHYRRGPEGFVLECWREGFEPSTVRLQTMDDVTRFSDAYLAPDGNLCRALRAVGLLPWA
jgi:hypothetical protein